MGTNKGRQIGREMNNGRRYDVELRYKVQPGDRLRIRRGLFFHDCIAGYPDAAGIFPVYQVDRHGARCVYLEEFSQGRRVQLIPYRGKTPRDLIVQRAQAWVGTWKYDILTHNCEHFCELCQNGRPRSNQVLLGALGAAGTLVTMLALNKR